MNRFGTLAVSALGDRQIVLSRGFSAPRHLVYQAFTKPHLVRRWLLGPEGWSMPTCEIDVRIGGAYRYVWQNDENGTTMGVGGIYQDVVPEEKLVASEKFDEAWYPGEAQVTTTFEGNSDSTIVTLDLLYGTKEARDMVLQSGMKDGVGASYERLEDALATIPDLDDPVVVQTADQPVARIRLTIPRAEIQSVMGPGIQELFAAVANQGIETSGPWFTHHLAMSPEVFDFEICVPTTESVSAIGRVEPGVLPAATVARTIFHGGYEGLADAWSTFTDWIRSEGLQPREDLWEVYATGPESSSNPDDWRTELNRPLEG